MSASALFFSEFSKTWPYFDANLSWFFFCNGMKIWTSGTASTLIQTYATSSWSYVSVHVWVCFCMYVCVCCAVSVKTNFNPSVRPLVILLFKQVDCHWQEKSKTNRAPRGNAICRHGNETTGRERGPVELSGFESPVSPQSLFIWFLTRAAHFACCKSSHLPSLILLLLLLLFCSETNGHRRGHICQQHRPRVIYWHGESEHSFPLVKPPQLLPLPTGESRRKRRWPNLWINSD